MYKVLTPNIKPRVQRVNISPGSSALSIQDEYSAVLRSGALINPLHPIAAK